MKIITQNIDDNIYLHIDKGVDNEIDSALYTEVETTIANAFGFSLTLFGKAIIVINNQLNVNILTPTFNQVTNLIL